LPSVLRLPSIVIVIIIIIAIADRNESIITVHISFCLYVRPLLLYA